MLDYLSDLNAKISSNKINQQDLEKTLLASFDSKANGILIKAMKTNELATKDLKYVEECEKNLHSLIYQVSDADVVSLLAHAIAHVAEYKGVKNQQKEYQEIVDGFSFLQKELVRLREENEKYASFVQEMTKVSDKLPVMEYKMKTLEDKNQKLEKEKNDLIFAMGKLRAESEMLKQQQQVTQQMGSLTVTPSNRKF